MAKPKRIIYRDTRTGRFASQSTWRRSRAHGGNRYKRVTFRLPAKRGFAPRVRPAALPELREWLVTFTYEKTGRSFDLVVTGRNEADTFMAAKNFIAADADAKRIAEARYHGWDLSIAKAAKSTHREGHVEYRQPED